MMCKDGENR